MASLLERLRAALAPGIVVERKLGDGAMGEVYLGHDVMLDRPVAIKVLKPERATAVAAERFAREARSVAGLRHPNLVRVHHAGEVDGLPYYTMDYVAGETLAAWLAGGHLSASQVVRLGLELLAALGAAHAKGLVHRDVKPSNIFFAGERVLLGDFGIAHAMDSSLTALTQPGSPVGTLAYISPEQLHDGEVTTRTDIYAVGLVLYEAATGQRWPPLSDPSKGDWSRVPKHLREPIRHALQFEPRDRWPDAAAFAAALADADAWAKRRARLRTAWASGAAGAAGLALLLILERSCGEGSGSKPAMRDLVIFPFATAGLADSTIGPRLAGATGWAFERLEGLTLVPRQIAFRIWRTSDLPPARRLAELTGERTRSRHGVWAIVRPRGTQLDVHLSVVDGRGGPVFEGSVAGDSLDLLALGDKVVFTLLQAVVARADPRFRKAEALSHVAPAALNEFFLGEEAFAQDAWLTAERHYLRALRLDTTFVLAGWRLGNARRWMPLRTEPPYPPGLFDLFQANPQRLPEVDRYLIEAQFRPSGAPRFERYEQAIRVAGDDPNAALLYGDELFHRGPLAGRPLQEAVRLLERAVAIDSTLAPAWEHLAWALIRLGEAEGAQAALAQLQRWAGPPEESEIYLPMFLRMAYELRFGPPASEAQVQATLGRIPGALALAARGALAFDLPAAQAALGSTLAASGEGRDVRASGLVARGVALVALGRWSAALVSLDSAALLFPDPREARLQAAEWRVVPSALGVPGVDRSEQDRGRETLRTLASDPATAPRAAWALALDSYARGDTAAARAWSSRVRASPGDAARLLPLLAGLGHAARGRWADALAATEPALAFDSAGYAPDPFFRAALHLQRGEWLARLGRAAEADRAWLWYDNVDVRWWPEAEAQPAEVDWALSTWARALRARLALGRESSAEGCGHARRAAEIWTEAEPPVADLAREMAALEQRCPR